MYLCNPAVTSLALETTKTLDFLKNKESISIFDHGIEFRKFNSPFHTLGGT